MSLLSRAGHCDNVHVILWLNGRTLPGGWIKLRTVLCSEDAVDLLEFSFFSPSLGGGDREFEL